MQRGEVDVFFVAMSRFKRKKFEESIELCNELLERNPRDQAAWLLKCKALAKKQWVDDLEIEEEGLADLLMDENALASVPRPGTSFDKPLTGQQKGGISQMVRPMSNAGRPITGFARPGTNRPVTGSKGVLTTALSGNRPATSARPITSGGRFLRLGTASMVQEGSTFLFADKINAKKVAKSNNIARAVCDYLIYMDNNPRKALEIALEANANTKNADWWWKARMGKCYFKLGLLRDAEKYFIQSLEDGNMISTQIELAKVAVKLDQPGKALQTYSKAQATFPNEIHIILGMARIYDMLNDPTKSIQFYRKVLAYEACNVESIACLASYHFYTDQPENALRFYRRLIQIGVNNAEIWNNLALCSYYASQFDLCLTCLERALSLSDESNLADIWYNISHIAIGVGDLRMAYQALKNAISADHNHAESFNNLGVLELKRGNVDPEQAADQARSNFATSSRLTQYLFEPCYNGGLLAYKFGEFQESYNLTKKAIDIFPDHADSKELMKTLTQHFSLV